MFKSKPQVRDGNRISNSLPFKDHILTNADNTCVIFINSGVHTGKGGVGLKSSPEKKNNQYIL